MQNVTSMVIDSCHDSPRHRNTSCNILNGQRVHNGQRVQRVLSVARQVVRFS